MPNLSNWLPRQAASEPVPGSKPPPTSTFYPRIRDPNAPDHRLQLTSKSIYERQLPGGSYITAHVERLQSGYYDSPVIHEDCINNVRFLGIRFVFHEASTERRFRSATIRLTVHDENSTPATVQPPQLDHPSQNGPPTEPPRIKPKFLRFAPHLLYGAMSPETLDWNFNLAGSLGVAQTPVSASINPSGGVKSSYKIYKMMKIQGSIRSNTSWYGKQYDVEDGELVWTLEENELQKSGLPREFTFVMMLTKGDSANDVRFEMDIKTEVAAWFGTYPHWWTHIPKYQPLHKDPLNLDVDIGQRFQPCDPALGFNFAGLMSTFEDYVTLPGTLYSTNDWGATSQGQQPPTTNSGGNESQQKQLPQGHLTLSPTDIDQKSSETPSNTLHLRIHLDQARTKHSHTLSVDQSSPEAATKSRRSPQPVSTPPASSIAKSDSTPKTTSSKPTKLLRSVTLNKALASTPPKYKMFRVTPLQTHFEERQPSPAKKQSPSESEDTDQDYIPSFPESLPTPPELHPLNVSSFLAHRHTKSSSTTSSAAAAGHKITAAPTPAQANSTTPTNNASSSANHSLRRSRSRSGLRKASLHSEPEDEEAIAAAMDMLSGSPPPPISSAPKSSNHLATISADDTILATPRTRATLADLMEVEQAENARVRRRNGTLRQEVKAPAQAGDLNPGRSHETNYITTRSRDRDRNREKRYSMPVTSTGIGYSNIGGSSSSRAGDGSIEGIGTGTGTTDRNSMYRPVVGNGRSSLMIPVGSKRETSNGLGIGLPNGSVNGGSRADEDSGRSVSRRRDG